MTSCPSPSMSGIAEPIGCAMKYLSLQVTLPSPTILLYAVLLSPSVPCPFSQDVFDMVYLTAYFDQPLYLQGRDGLRTRIEDLWTKTEAENLAAGLELRCPVQGQHEPRTLQFVSSPSVYPVQCTRGHNQTVTPHASSSRTAELVAPMPQHRWMEQVFSSHPATADPTGSNNDADDWTLSDDASWGVGANAYPLIFVAKHHPAATLPASATHVAGKKEDSYVSSAKRCALETTPSLTLSDLSSCTVHFRNLERTTNANTNTNSTTDVSLSTTQVIPLTNFRGQRVKQGLSSLIQVSRSAPVKLWSVSGAHIDETETGSYIANATQSTNSDNNSTIAAQSPFPGNWTEELVTRLKMREAQCSAAVSEQRAVFLETSMGQAAGIVKPVIDMFVGDMMDQFSDLVLQDLSQEMASNMAHAVGGPMVDMIVMYTMRVVPRNLTHRISDFVADHLVRLLSTAVPNRVSGILAGRIYKFTTPLIKEKLTRILSQTLPNHISYGLPELISRALPILLASKLTRSITHALVPSVARGVSITYHFSYLCFLCNHFRAHCSDCNHLQISQHQIQYYAAWYSEYYSGYYGDYYRDALYMIQHFEYTGDSRTSTETPDLAVKAAEEAAKAAANAPDSLGGQGSEGYGGGTGTPGVAEPEGSTDSKPATRIFPDEEADKIPEVAQWEHPFKLHSEAEKEAAEARETARWGDQKGGGSVGNLNDPAVLEENALPPPELIE